jgi:hypothetical protein
MGLHGAAAAVAAVADSEKPSKRGFLEKRVMDMSSFCFCKQYINRFFSINYPASLGMMCSNETDKRVSHN